MGKRAFLVLAALLSLAGAFYISDAAPVLNMPGFAWAENLIFDGKFVNFEPKLKIQPAKPGRSNFVLCFRLFAGATFSYRMRLQRHFGEFSLILVKAPTHGRSTLEIFHGRWVWLSIPLERPYMESL
jgi:hypothetical protein